MRILASKYEVPTIPENLILRSRLLESINISSSANLFLFRAPAGFGKTTFAAQLYKQLPTNHIKTWLTVDENEQNSERLIKYVTIGLSNSSRELNKFIKTENSSNSTIQEQLDNICFIFQEQIETQHWLFLDNWESADNNDNGRLIDQLIQHTNEKLKIVITSRIKPSIKLYRLEEKNIVHIFEQKDLRFSFAEFMESLSRRKLHFEKSELEQLWNLSKGWCINTAFINESFKQNKINIPVSSKTIFDFNLSDNYIFEEFMNSIDDDIINNLIISSFSNIISAEVLSVLLDSEKEVKCFISFLKNSSIPLNKYSTNEFKYHPLFRHTLNKLAQDKLDRETIYTLNNKLISFYISNNQYLDALEKVSLLENNDFLLEFIDKHWLQLVEHSGLKAIQVLLSNLATECNNHPLYIKLYSNVLSQTGDNSSLIEFLSDKIDTSLHKMSDPLLSTLWVKYYWSILHSINRPSYKEVLASWNKIEKSKGPYLEKDKIGVETTLSCAAYMELNFDNAKQHIINSINYIGDSSFIYKVNQLDNLAIFEFYTGNKDKALQIYHENQIECKRRKVYHGMSNRLLYVAWIFITTGQIQKGLATIDEAEQIMFKHESFDAQAKMFAERYRGVASYYLGYYELALEYLNNSLEYAKKYNNEEIVYTKIYIDYFHLLLNKPKTILNREDINSLNEYSQSNLLYLAFESYKGFLNKKRKSCQENADKLLNISTKSKLSSWQALAYFLLALNAELSNNYSLTNDYFLKGMSILQKNKLHSYPMYNNELTEKLVIHAVKSGKSLFINKIIESDYTFEFSSDIDTIIRNAEYNTKDLIQLFKVASDNSVYGLESLAKSYLDSEQSELKKSVNTYLNTISKVPLPPLNIYIFGSFYVLSNNRQIQYKRKKSKQLLHILTIKYPNSVHEEELIELLWPYSDLTKGKSSLRTAVKDLRKDLDKYHQTRKDTYITYKQAHYNLYLPEYSEIDSVEFRKISEDVLNTSNHISDEQCIDLCYKCVQLYKNRLLTDEMNSQYSIEDREYYHSLYQKVILKYSASLINENRSEEAVEALEKSIEYDPLWREGIEQLIKVNMLLNKSLNAYKVFNNYKKTLEQELGIKPDIEITQLVNKIV